MATLECITTWVRQPQERNDQKYLFSGRFYFTKDVFEKLTFDEIAAIYQDVRNFAKQRNGIDYLQVYTDGEGRSLFFIDQLDKGMVESGEYEKEHNYCTLQWAKQY